MYNLHLDSIEFEKQAQAEFDKVKDLADDDEKKVAAKKKLEYQKTTTATYLKDRDDAKEKYAKMN